MASFSKSEAIKYGWDTVTKRIKFFVLLMLIIIGVSIIPSFVIGFFEENDLSLLGFLVTLLNWGLQLVISLGVIGVALRIYDKKKTEYKNLFDYFHLIIPYFFASILYGLIVIGGFILLIIPGIIWSIKFRYYTYFMVDKNMGPIEALKASSKITQNNKWNLFLLSLLLGLINILGVLAFFVGIFVTAPLAMMAEAYVFRRLQSSK